MFLQASLTLARWQRANCSLALSQLGLPAFKIASIINLTGRGAGVPAGFCSARQHISALAPRPVRRLWHPSPICWQPPAALPAAAGCRHSWSAYNMANQEKTMISSQPSGLLQQMESQIQVPLSMQTPATTDRRPRKSKQLQALSENHALPDTLVHTAFGESLADRIKAGSGRRRTAQSKAHVPSAAVDALAEVVDRVVAPSSGATERYLDSRDADSNIPPDVPGASAEQQQHAAEQAGMAADRQQATDESVATHSQQDGAVQIIKPQRRKKAGKSSKSDLLQTGSELALEPGVTTNVLEENDKVRPVGRRVLD